VDRSRADEEDLSARRLYRTALPRAGEVCALGSEAAQHAHVLRLGVGDTLELFDGRGSLVRVRIVTSQKRELTCEALAEPEFSEPGPQVVLVQCVPRGAKLDEIVRMTTEIGVGKVQLAWSEHCVPRKNESRDQHKIERLNRIAVEAARQSEQAYVPDIGAPRPLRDVLQDAPGHAFRAALLERSDAPLPERLQVSEAWLVVGPEGGLSEGDRGEIAKAGFSGLSLGRSILRTETAAVVGVGLLAERLRRCR
jgi:16S rRNA (uracil1498-N3)-methyltransferase